MGKYFILTIILTLSSSTINAQSIIGNWNFIDSDEIITIIITKDSLNTIHRDLNTSEITDIFSSAHYGIYDTANMVILVSKQSPKGKKYKVYTFKNIKESYTMQMNVNLEYAKFISINQAVEFTVNAPREFVGFTLYNEQYYETFGALKNPERMKRKEYIDLLEMLIEKKESYLHQKIWPFSKMRYEYMINYFLENGYNPIYMSDAIETLNGKYKNHKKVDSLHEKLEVE